MLNATTRKRLEKAQKGQSLVEMAISMVLLTMILSAVIDLGRLWFTYLALEDAVGEAALFMSVFPYCVKADSPDPTRPLEVDPCADPDNAEWRARNAVTNSAGSVLDWQYVVFDPDDNHYVFYQGEDLNGDPIIMVGDDFMIAMDYKFYLISPFVPVTAGGFNPFTLRVEAWQSIIRENTSG
jgi:hypothetical protein